MKKLISLTLLLGVLITSITCFCSCDSTSEGTSGKQGGGIVVNNGGQTPQNDAQKNQITVNYNGQSNNLNIDENTTFEEIVASVPEQDGYVFAGWYSDAELKDYIDPQHITAAQKEKGTLNAKWIQVETKTYNVRSETATITDSGRANQKMDEVNMYGDFNLTDLKRAGYDYLTISVTLTLREENDGYQYVFIYADTECSGKSISSVMDFYETYVFGTNNTEDPSLLYMYKYEHGSGSKSTNWETITFETKLDIERFAHTFYLRYGASGKDEDTWQNKDIHVSITPEKE